MKKTPSHKGFTLIELIMVIVLIGILSVVAIPYISNTQFFSLDTAVRKLESDIRYAQNLAITTGDSYGFRTVIDASATNYEIYNVTTGNPIESPYTHASMQEDFSGDFPGIEFKNNDDFNVRFDSNGTPTVVTGVFPMTLESKSGDEKTISINSIGLISVQ